MQFLWLTCIVLTLVLVPCAHGGEAPFLVGDGTYWRWSFQTNSSPSTTDPQSSPNAQSTLAMTLSCNADFELWIPARTERLRGVIVHQHGCGTGAEEGGSTAAKDYHWQSLAHKWNLALLCPKYHAGDERCGAWADPGRGSEAVFLQALQELAKLSGRAELTEVPWCLWGHSGGGHWASRLLAKHPERVIAAWLRSGTALGNPEGHSANALGNPTPTLPATVYKIPIVCNPGALEQNDPKFKEAWASCHEMFVAFRKQDAPICFAADPITSHECGDSRYCALLFFDVCLAARLPDDANTSAPLRELNRAEAHLGSRIGSQPQQAADFDIDGVEKYEACYLINAEFAEAWYQYVNTGSITDKSPPPAPVGVKLVRTAEGPKLVWRTPIDAESGLMGFMILKEGNRVARLLGKPRMAGQRATYQGVSYHDTPLVSVPPMEWLVESPTAGLKASAFQVVSVNALGVPSPPTQAAEAE